ncbi:MAG: hypothetical protein M3619_12815 [Myxococcota bacterium]|nr:hypothetical protein [Myxococcota bacterium]
MAGMISFVFSNPRHHAEILLPVVRHLQGSGVACRVVSIAELRGLATPKWELGGAAVKKALPVPRPGRIPPPAASELSGRRTLGWRALAHQSVWKLALGPRLRWLLRGSRCVVVPNDAAFPYLQLVRELGDRRVPVVLVQEGIRFPFPADTGSEYGKTGATRVCVWGQGSAEHFASIGVPPSHLCVTGNPRFDTFDVAGFRARREATLAELGLAQPPLVFLSNPVETQGFCSADDKLALFAKFLREAATVTNDVPIAVKLHSYEEPAAFARAAERAGVPVTMVPASLPLFALLAVARAAVVLASTVGLEALVFGVPLGVLQIPGHDFAFEYVQRGAAIGIAANAIPDGVAALLGSAAGHGRGSTDTSRFVERHLAHRGHAAEHVGDAILEAMR